MTLFFSMRAEILRFVDMIHREKDIDKEAVFLGLEAAIRSAIAKKWGEADDAVVSIDRESGEVTAVVGGRALDQRQLQEQLGRLAAQTGKQVLFQKIREAAREVVYQEFVGRIGTLVNGVVQRFEGPNLIVNLQRGEGVLPRSEQVPTERFRIGDRIKVLVRDVVRNGNQVKIILSRSDPQFVKQLFELEVPEIKEGTIEIVAIAREPGHRTKIGVTSADANVDCVGACVGVRGTRVKSIREELFGEKIEIVPWDDTQEVLIMNALKPAKIVSIDLDYNNRRARVYVTPDQQSLAIGRRGQNVRLASELCNWDIDIVAVSMEDIERLRTEDVEQGEDIGEVVGTGRSAVKEEEEPQAEAQSGEAPEVGEPPETEERIDTEEGIDTDQSGETFEAEEPSEPDESAEPEEALQPGEPPEAEPVEQSSDEPEREREDSGEPGPESDSGLEPQKSDLSETAPEAAESERPESGNEKTGNEESPDIRPGEPGEAPPSEEEDPEPGRNP